METYQIDILNPKATKLLEDLADLKLISIKKSKSESLIQTVQALRKKASKDTPSLTEITKEVEMVRLKRYERKKG